MFCSYCYKKDRASGIRIKQFRKRNAGGGRKPGKRVKKGLLQEIRYRDNSDSDEEENDDDGGSSNDDYDEFDANFYDANPDNDDDDSDNEQEL